MLTVRALAGEVGLELAAGGDAADAPVRWVHISELQDPTPWLSGGELLLTTGIQLKDEACQRDFVRRLAGHHLAGLGFGVGFGHDELPPALVDEAKSLGFPVFAVPYELPFIALTELAFTRLVNEQYEVLQRGIGIHKRLERLVLEERGLEEVVRALAAAIGGAVAVLSARGDTIASKVFRRNLPDGAVASVRAEVRERSAGLATAAEAAEFAPSHPELSGRSLVLPVAIRGRGAPQAWLMAARDGGGLGDFERLILNQAVTVVALELMRQRAMRDTERRLAGDVLAEALTGRLSEEELATRLAPFGIGDEAAVLVFAADGQELAVPPLEGELSRHLADAGMGALVATRGRLLCAVVDARDGTDPATVAERARDALATAASAESNGGGGGGGGQVRAAVSRPAPVGALRRSFHEARCALEASELGNGPAPAVASYRDLGAFQLLLSLQDDDALRLYCDSVLGPLEDATAGKGDPSRGTPSGYGDELIRSLEAFIEQNGQWERAARELFCHRHTLRYRIRRVEQLTGRDLSNARDRIEFWLALRARELVA